MSGFTLVGVLAVIGAACAAALALLHWLRRRPLAVPNAPVGKGLHAGLGVAAVLAAALLLGNLAPLFLKHGLGPGSALALQLAAAGASVLALLHLGALRPLWLVFALLGVHGLDFALSRALTAPGGVGALGAYVLGVAALAGAANWRGTHMGRAAALLGPSLFGFVVAGACALAGVFAGGHAPAALASLLALAAGAAVLGLLQPRLAIAAPLLALAAAAAIWLWPLPEAVVFDPQAARVAAGLAMITSLTGLGLIVTRRAAGVGAVLAGFGPLAALLAVSPLGTASLAHPWWGLAALVAAVQSGLAFLSASPAELLARRILAAGAAAGLVVSVALLGGLAWAVPAAAGALLLAGLGRRPGGAPLRAAAALPALAATGAGLGGLAGASAGPAVLPLAADAAAAFLLLMLAARALPRDGAKLARTLLEFAGVVLSLTALLALANAAVGQLAAGAGETGLYRTGAHCLALIAAAVTLAHAPQAWLSPQTRRWAQNAILAGAGVYVLLATLSVVNPWWGMSPQPVPGAVVFNPLLAGYLAPALAFGLYARVLPRAKPRLQRRWTQGMAALLALLWGVLEARRLGAGPDLAAGVPSWSPEALLLAGLILLAAGVAAALLLLGAPGTARLARLARARQAGSDPNLSPPP
jgi:hypothetical protein